MCEASERKMSQLRDPDTQYAQSVHVAIFYYKFSTFEKLSKSLFAFSYCFAWVSERKYTVGYNLFTG